jgi:hypothetical protein
VPDIATVALFPTAANKVELLEATAFHAPASSAEVTVEVDV